MLKKTKKQISKNIIFILISFCLTTASAINYKKDDQLLLVYAYQTDNPDFCYKIKLDWIQNRCLKNFDLSVEDEEESDYYIFLSIHFFMILAWIIIFKLIFKFIKKRDEVFIRFIDKVGDFIDNLNKKR